MEPRARRHRLVIAAVIYVVLLAACAHVVALYLLPAVGSTAAILVLGTLASILLAPLLSWAQPRGDERTAAWWMMSATPLATTTAYVIALRLVPPSLPEDAIRVVERGIVLLLLLGVFYGVVLLASRCRGRRGKEREGRRP